MAERPLQIDPVFLSASVPDPERDRRYFETGNAIAIRNAVIALVTVVLPRTKLVFGGHPAITPLVKWVADQAGDFDRVRMFQSKFFRQRYLKDIEVFRYVEINADGEDEQASLLAMRTAMLASERRFSAAIFIGGMDGVEREYELLARQRPQVPRFPVFTSGAAARILWEREMHSLAELPAAIRPLHEKHLRDLQTRTSYVALFTRLLEELPPQMNGFEAPQEGQR
jgi:hypothetical protein